MHKYILYYESSHPDSTNFKNSLLTLGLLRNLQQIVRSAFEFVYIPANIHRYHEIYNFLYKKVSFLGYTKLIF